MLMSLLSVVGVAIILLAVVVDSARNAASRRKVQQRATLIRLRLQDQPSESRPAYREIPIRLGQD